MAKKKSDSLKFGEARQELEGILREIEENEVDVDDLADRVKRAAELIRICREKLERTKMEVEKVVADLDRGGEDEGDAATEDAAGEGGSDERPGGGVPF